jgi:hypothetical protein
MVPRPPVWLFSEYKPEIETFSGWRKVFYYERESLHRVASKELEERVS